MHLNKCTCKRCRRFVAPHAFHRIFQSTGRGKAKLKLQEQAGILFALLAGCSQQAIHKLLKKNDKVTRAISKKHDDCCKAFVEDKEKSIKFGDGKE